MSNETTTSAPIHYLLPLFPCFQLLDVAGPLDILNLLSITHAPTKSITLTIVASTLDPVPTKPIPPIDPTTNQPRWTYPDAPQLDNNTTNTTFNQTLTPTATFTSYLSTIATAGTPTIHPPIDVLLIPGGIGTRMSRTYPDGHQESNIADLIDFVRAVSPHVRHSIVTVCTGSAALSQTGLLDSRRATTNMTRFDDVAAARPQTRWLKGRRWVRSLPRESENDTSSNRFEGEIWTSAGISAGMDVTLAFVAEFYGGVEVARLVSRRLEYEWREIAEGAVDPMYGFAPEDLESE